ncbi:hypothetical protein CAPTEDRAFT_188571 [Capitella teleta]|uniref:Ionotropic glutamate receptor L-glutamate and glycine-binding domain-containing protein n=1 Tax=Capitella teleta TaxID=283909 RepID=R7UHN8_CAPTE|nr:hypothetical protein CAPTEDRAFT_188571 [Capitella teleta]|eukprot:ELU06044.1 hypothetical protein CAPTEDRAFT_188571 [Capitella teleta]
MRFLAPREKHPGVLTDEGSEDAQLLEAMDNLLSHSPFNVSVHFVTITDNSFRLYLDVCSAASKGVATFISLASCDLQYTLQSLSMDIRIPLIQVNSDCPDNIQLDSNVDYLHRYPAAPVDLEVVLLGILDELGWSDLVLITDEIQDENLLNSINSACRKGNVTAQHFKITDDSRRSDVTSVLDFVAEEVSKEQFLVACGFPCIKELFRQANSYSYDGRIENHALFTFETSYVLIVMNDSMIYDITMEARDIDNVLLINPAQRNISHYHAMKALGHVVNTLLAINDSYTRFEIQLNTSSCNSCPIYEVNSLQWGPGRERKLELVAEWQEYKGMAKIQETLMVNKLRGFNGRTFRIGTNLWNPFVLENHTSASVQGYGGLSIELLKELSNNLNFSFTLHFPEDNGWGSYVNGSWTGLVGMLVNKEVDMVVASLSRTPAREMVVDFTAPYYLDHCTVLVKYPDLEDKKWKLFINPFRWQVWLVLAGVIPFSGLILWTLSRYSPYYSKEQAFAGLGLLDNAVFYTFGAFFTQGGCHLPDAQSGRFFTGFYWMACIVIVATYGGNLIAFLTVSKDVLPFDFFEEMVNQDEYKYGILNGTALTDYIDMASDSTMKQLKRNLDSMAKEDSTIYSKNHSTHITRVLKGGYGYIGDMTSFEVEMSNACDIDMIRETISPYEYSVALWENSAYRPLVNDEVSMIKESGLVKKWKADWWPRQSFCSRGLVTEAKAVSMDDVQGAYYLMAILLVVSFVALVAEGFWQKHNMNHKVNEAPGKESSI